MEWFKVFTYTLGTIYSVSMMVIIPLLLSSKSITKSMSLKLFLFVMLLVLIHIMLFGLSGSLLLGELFRLGSWID